MKTLIGYLRNVSDEYFYLDTDGVDLYLIFDGPHSTPINKQIALSVSDEPDADGKYHVTPVGKYFALGDPIRPRSSTGIWTSFAHALTTISGLLVIHRPVGDGEEQPCIEAGDSGAYRYGIYPIPCHTC